MADNFKQDIADDSGWKSRKLWLTFFGIAVISWGYWVTQYSAIFQGLYATFGGFVLGILATYFGVNASHSYIASKTPSDPPQPPVQ